MPDLEEQLRAYGSVLDDTEPGVAAVVELPAPRRRVQWIVAAAAVIVIAVAVAAIAVARDDSTRPRVATTPSTVVDPLKAPAPEPILAIGDGVMLSARDQLGQAVPGITVDATVNRQWSDVADVLRAAEPQPKTIVVAVGTNGPLTEAALDEFLAAAGDRRVVLINNRVSRPWEAENNALLRAALNRPGGNVTLVDWHKIAEGHDDWFASDLFHLAGEGHDAYASAIAGALGVPTVQGLAVEKVHPYDFFDGRTAIAEAGGDVWISSGTMLERRRPDGALIATIELPFTYGSDYMAASENAVWVNGMISDAGPEMALVRVDIATNAITLRLETPDRAACACPVAASAQQLAYVGDGGVTTIDARTGAMISATTDLPARALAVVDDTTYAANGEVVQVLKPGPNPLSIIEFPAGNGDVRALRAQPGGNVLALLASGLVYRIEGTTATEEGDARLSGNSVDEGDRVWVATGNALGFVSGRITANFLYEPTDQTFRRDPVIADQQQGGLGSLVAIGDRLWLVYNDDDVLQVRVTP
jgi:hypothetical protein